MSKKEFEPIFFLYQYLLTRIRNDRDGEFYIGIDDYQVLFDALYVQDKYLTIEDLETTICLLFAKSKYQEQRLRQHFIHIIKEYDQIMKQLFELENRETSNKDILPEIPTEIITGEESENKTQRVVQNNEEIPRRIGALMPAPLFTQTKYDISQKYQPATKRTMSQLSRRLQKGMNEEVFSDRFDIDKTIQSIAKQGFFLMPVFASESRKGKTYLLIDNSESMVPFDSLVNEYLMSLKSFVSVNTFYFNNSPSQNLYKERQNINALNLKEWFSGISKNSIIIIVSDGGAARGGLNERRIEDIEKWVREIKQRKARIVWLNPMPAARWLDSSAGAIRKYVRMFSLNSYNLEKAMQAIHR